MKSATLRALESQVESALAGRVLSPFAAHVRVALEMLPTGIAEVDALTGGVPRGGLTEIVGPTSSGRTTLLFSLLGRARAEVCALVDASDAFCPRAAADAGVELRRLLWVRCSAAENTADTPARRSPSLLRAEPARSTKREVFRRIEQALKTADLLLQVGGFGVVAIDLGDIAAEIARRVPLTSWFRFRRAVENTPTALLLVEQESPTGKSLAQSCASLVLRLENQQPAFAAGEASPAHSALLRDLRVQAEILHWRAQRKSPRSATAFAAHAPWMKRA